MNTDSATTDPVLRDLPGAIEWANSPHSQLLVTRMRAAIERLQARKDHKCPCGGKCSTASENELTVAREQIRAFGIVIAEIELAGGRLTQGWDARPFPVPATAPEIKAA